MESLLKIDGTFVKDWWLLDNDGNLVNELVKC